MPLIAVKNIEKVYADDEISTTALSGVSFEIEKGELVAIMGPSGSGKSTLLHILGFLDRQTKGSYLFSGKSFESYSDDEIAKIRNRKMGFIFQSFNLLPRTTVLDNVKLPLLYSEFPEADWDKKSKQVIEKVGLSHRLQHETSQLSGGEKQRVAIARAMVNDPEVIFADEPTGNLDSKTGKTVIETLIKTSEELGHTVILVTHDQHIADYAKRIITIKDGKLESDTSAGSV